MRQLKFDLDDYEKTVIRDNLRQLFEAALHQAGVPPGIVPQLALMFAHNTVKDMMMLSF